MNEAVDKALGELELVFPERRPLEEHEITDHFCPECEEVQKVFAGKNWRDFLRRSYDLLGYFAREPEIVMSRDSLCLLTSKAFVLFLPVFLSAMMSDPGEADVMIGAMPNEFDPGPKKGPDDEEQWKWREEKARERLSLMTKEQREVVAAALEWFQKDATGTTVFPTYADAIENLRSGEPNAWKKRQEKRGSD